MKELIVLTCGWPAGTGDGSASRISLGFLDMMMAAAFCAIVDAIALSCGAGLAATGGGAFFFGVYC